MIAAKELQESYLIDHQYDHNFGLDCNESGMVIGKMFGVLVVQYESGQIGYLGAFSGKLADSNHHEGFVPPIYDMLQSQSHFNEEEEIINRYNRDIEEIESDELYLSLLNELTTTQKESAQTISEIKARIKKEKAERKTLRKSKEFELSEAEYQILLKQLEQKSIKSSYYLKDEINYWKHKIDILKKQTKGYQNRIDELKEKRKNRSNQLQKHLFKKYSFLNALGEQLDLLEIFNKQLGVTPPAGAGECAAPKLLQYAYIHNLRPIAMAEFWWGQSPKSQVRKHKQFYPACRSKCEPILGHMLQGLDVEDNPIIAQTDQNLMINIIYEDDQIAIINKPLELLSVPGKTITDSVWARMKLKYPQATGPLIVHRLDMSTSGIMVIALTKEAHKFLQQQFIKKTAHKRYTAILEGAIPEESGSISLPLRVDLDNRPQQLVCFDYGKEALTKWKKIKVENGFTTVSFYPLTGRTHQLRVHAAHTDGLNTPILGDDLYGNKGARLHLHATELSITHPKTRELVNFEVEPDWHK